MANRFNKPSNWLRRHLWRVTALGMLIALVGGSLGLAIPGKLVKNTDVPFPCMNSPCGCTDAETCWQSCCCHSQAERLQWAREHHVTPPAYFTAVETSAVEEKPTCCQQQVVTASCCATGNRPTCCSAKKSCCEQVAQQDESVMTWRKSQDAGKQKPVRIVLIDVLRCHGLSSSWTLLPPTIVPPAVSIDDAPSGLSECVAIVEEFFSGEVPPPDLPPPKNAA